jgi:CubicO group peptidase (beta-lactamase class C family)
MKIGGYCDDRFTRVAEEFERNFAERGEVGASVAVTHRGEYVVDLWAGTADPTTAREWAERTVGIVQSCTKTAYALCAHVLVHRGRLDLDEPVARYWPEFAAAGKADIPVWMVLSHLAAVPAIRKEQPRCAYLNPEAVVADLAAEAPFWEPGTRVAYHNTTFGYLVGEIVRRISGCSVGTFFREEVAGPLGLDFWIGLPADEHHRVAPSIDPPPDPNAEPDAIARAMGVPGSVHAHVLQNSAGYFEPGMPDRPEALATEIPNGGVTNARGLAGMYAPLSLDGTHRGVRLVDRHDIARMAAVRAAGIDAVLLRPVRVGLGFQRSVDNRRSRTTPTDSMVMSDEAFGHQGGGGRACFADPGGQFSFGYTMNLMGTGTGLNERGQSLIDATYRSFGYTADRYGTWVR